MDRARDMEREREKARHMEKERDRARNVEKERDRDRLLSCVAEAMCTRRVAEAMCTQCWKANLIKPCTWPKPSTCQVALSASAVEDDIASLSNSP